MAQDLDQLIGARLVQAAGGGILVPVGTAAAAHLFDGAARPRALGVIGALTFLGMAAGPFLGAAILSTVHPEEALLAAGLGTSTLADIAGPAWRWIFYVNVPIGLVGLVVAWAAGAGWDTPRRAGRVDVVGAALFGIALAAGLVGLTLLGATTVAGTDLAPATVSAGLGGLALVATVLAVARGLRAGDPFLDIRLFRRVPFSAAALVSLLTGYAFATAIIGGAVFVDRVLYGGPDEQRLALGSLAAATAFGALVSGFAVRVASYRIVTLAGLALSVGGLAAMAAWNPTTPIRDVALALGTVRLRVRAVGDAAFDGRGGGRGHGRVRGRVVGRDGRPDARHGDRPGRAHGVRLHDDRPPLPRDLRHARCVSRLHPGDPARPAPARPAGRGSPRVVGLARGRIDHGRAVRRRRPGDGGGRAAGPGARWRDATAAGPRRPCLAPR